MLRKIVDVLKEVFWIKPSRKRRKPARRKAACVRKKSSKIKPKVVAAKQPAKSAAKMVDPALKEVGVITHYFDRIKVGVVKLTNGTILIGDKLTISGSKTKFVQKV